MRSVTKGFEAVEDDIKIDLPRNPRNHRQLDHTKYLGLGFDAWAIQSLHVIKALLQGGNFSVTTLIGYSTNGLRFFINCQVATCNAKQSYQKPLGSIRLLAEAKIP